MQVTKHAVASHVLPMLNRLMAPFRLKISKTGTPNRDFGDFVAHLKSLDFQIKTVIDVGVAFGTPALYESLPRAKFYLVEPVPQCKPLLDKWERTMGATCFNVAAGAEDGETEFFVHDDISGSSALRQVEGEALDGKRIKVPVRRLDSLIPSSIERPSLLKIDVQGHELEVLKGAQRLIDNIDVVIIETSFHEFREGAPEIHDIVGAMAKLGYRCYEILEGHYRAIDNAMAQVDVAFIKQDSVLRSSKRFFDESQVTKYLATPRRTIQGLDNSRGQ